MSFIVALLLFDGYIVLMQDDADYLLGAFNFVNYGIFPLAHDAILYHLVLTLPALIWGINLTAVKILSICWAMVTFWMTYKVFKELVNPVVLFGLLWIVATNFAIQYYSSSVMSESFFMMIQMLFVAGFYSNYDRLMTSINVDVKGIWFYLKGIAGLVGVAFLLALSKSIGVVAPIAVIVYLLLYKKWKQAIVFGSAFAAVKVTFDTSIKLLFDLPSISNRHSLLLKNYYDASQGEEDAIGMVVRMWTNFDYHISTDFLRFLGFRPNLPNGLEPITWFSVLFLALFALCLFWALTKRRKLLFVGIYSAGLASAIFLALQTHWQQDRMILILTPFIVLFCIQMIFDYVQDKKPALTGALFGIVALMCFLNLRHLPARIESNVPVLQKFILGDRYAAYTPDWKNYLGAAEWAAVNLPNDKIIACRKPNSSSVYANGQINFQGLHRSPKETGDVVLGQLQEMGVTHIILANLRANPARAVSGQVIGTVHNYVRAIRNYNPNALKLLQQFGQEEPAYIFEITY